MKKLLKQYGFNSDIQYLEMIIESVINGQFQQAKAQFTALPRNERKNFVCAILLNWKTELSQDNKKMFIELI